MVNKIKRLNIKILLNIIIVLLLVKLAGCIRSTSSAIEVSNLSNNLFISRLIYDEICLNKIHNPKISKIIIHEYKLSKNVVAINSKGQAQIFNYIANLNYSIPDLSDKIMSISAARLNSENFTHMLSNESYELEIEQQLASMLAEQIVAEINNRVQANVGK